MPFERLRPTHKRAPEPFHGVRVARSVTGKSLGTRFTISNDVMKRMGLSVGDRVAVLVGNGAHTGRIAIAKDTQGDLRVQSYNKTGCQFATTRIPAKFALTQRDANYDVDADGLLTVVMPADRLRTTNGADPTALSYDARALLGETFSSHQAHNEARAVPHMTGTETI